MNKIHLPLLVSLVFYLALVQVAPASAAHPYQAGTMYLSGTVQVGQVFVPAGTTVTALIDGVPFVTTDAYEISGIVYYSFIFPGAENVTFTFMVGDLQAEQSIALQDGVYTLDLTAILTLAWVDDDYGSVTGGWGLDHFASIQTAIDALAPGGAIQVEPGIYPGTILIPKPLVLIGNSFPILDSGGNAAVACSADGDVLIKGFSLQNADPVFHLGAITCNLVAYANNFPSDSAACIADGCPFANLKHNWWGSFTTQPLGLNELSWSARLGAPVLDWDDGNGIVSLGTAALAGENGQSDLAAIVDHGDTPPFVASSSEVMCSNYYDFFLVQVGPVSPGIWSLSVPVNTSIDPCRNLFDALTPMKLAYVTDIQTCLTSPSLCWDSWPSVTKAGDHLLVASSVGVSDLEGTPFVAGNPNDRDPTALLLVSLNAASAADIRVILLVAIGAIILLGACFGILRILSRE